MTGPLYRIGTFCVRHRFVVVPLWIVLAVVLILVSASVGRQASDDVSLPGTDSQRAADTLSARFPKQANGTRLDGRGAVSACVAGSRC